MRHLEIEIVETALAKLSASPTTAVVVGDTPYDVQGARAGGVACIGVTSWMIASEFAGRVRVFSGPLELVQSMPARLPFEVAG